MSPAGTPKTNGGMAMRSGTVTESALGPDPGNWILIGPIAPSRPAAVMSGEPGASGLSPRISIVNDSDVAADWSWIATTTSSRNVRHCDGERARPRPREPDRDRADRAEQAGGRHVGRAGGQRIVAADLDRERFRRR